MLVRLLRTCPFGHFLTGWQVIFLVLEFLVFVLVWTRTFVFFPPDLVDWVLNVVVVPNPVFVDFDDLAGRKAWPRGHTFLVDRRHFLVRLERTWPLGQEDFFRHFRVVFDRIWPRGQDVFLLEGAHFLVRLLRTCPRGQAVTGWHVLFVFELLDDLLELLTLDFDLVDFDPNLAGFNAWPFGQLLVEGWHFLVRFDLTCPLGHEDFLAF